MNPGSSIGTIYRAGACGRISSRAKHLHEQPFDLLEKAPPKRRDRVVIGMVVCCDEAERHRIVRRTLQLPAGKHACGVAVNQNAQQQCWVIGRRSRAPIAPAHPRQVKPVNHLNDEPRQVRKLRKSVPPSEEERPNQCKDSTQPR